MSKLLRLMSILRSPKPEDFYGDDNNEENMCEEDFESQIFVIPLFISAENCPFNMLTDIIGTNFCHWERWINWLQYKQKHVDCTGKYNDSDIPHPQLVMWFHNENYYIKIQYYFDEVVDVRCDVSCSTMSALMDRLLSMGVIPYNAMCNHVKL